MSSKAQIRNTDRLDKQEQQRETNTTNKYLLSIYSLQGVSRSMRQDPCSFRAYFLLLNKVRIMLYITQSKTLTLYQMLSQGYVYTYIKPCLNCTQLRYICNLLNHFSILITLAHYLMVSSFKWHCKNQKVYIFSESKYIHFLKVLTPNCLKEDHINLYSHSGI